LVIGPRRRRFPEDCSDGTTQRWLITCAGCMKRVKSPISAHRAAVSVSIPRRHIDCLAVCAHVESGNERAISASSCSRRIIKASTAPR
jgi:hypothetical protein